MILYQIPDNIDRLFTINLRKPLKLVKDVTCLKCNKKNHANDFSSVTFKNLIDDYEMKGILTNDKSSYFNKLKYFQLNPMPMIHSDFVIIKYQKNYTK